MNGLISRTIEYIKTGIWTKKPHEYKSGKSRWWAQQFKVLIFMVTSSSRHNIGVRSAALTYFTLMSIVPIAALIFGVIKGFGLEQSFQSYLYRELPQFSGLLDQLIAFANNMIERARGGVIAAAGLVVLFWSVIMVFGNIEQAFNAIWEVRKARSIGRKLADYLAVVILAPILFVISNSASAYVRRELSVLVGSFWIDVLFWFVSLTAVWIMFALIYRMMPNTKVKIRNAIIAGMVAGTIFLVFQGAYFWIQTKVSTYNAIYGTFAALPLFLIWLQASWQILLYGGELSYAYQNVGQFELERQSQGMNYDTRRKVMLAIMLVSIRRFRDRLGSITSDAVAKELALPLRAVRDVIYDLLQCGLLVAVKTHEHSERVNEYIPGRDIHSISVFDVVDTVERGCDEDAEWIQNADMERVGQLLDRMRDHAAQSPDNVMLIDLA